MTIIDIHTHMLSRGFLDALVTGSAGQYRVGRVPAGDEAIFTGDTAFVTLTPGMFDYGLRVSAMDAAGVDLAVVSLTCPNVFWGDAQASAAAARLINDDMAAAQSEYPDRIRFLATIPWQYPDLAMAELARACERGAVGVMVLANIDGVSLTDPAFAPVWAEIDRRALPVLVHPTSPAGVEQMDISRYHLVWSVGFTFDTTLALSRMIMDGFFDRYRNLTIVGGHAGGYLPFVLSRLDAGYRSFESCRAAIDRLPSSYAEQIYVDSIVYSPEALRTTLDVMGSDHVLYGSDYPHKNGRMEEIIEIVGTAPESARSAILGGTAEKIFRL
ncbi:amidohydrolase family protein [Actinospica sp.]|jgi:aminocarboxymuconate-semialdehyde decarboxylase|uniref:amidohydrolase family protein n=1 Tax=Actinospica sp. TaxID=1872142 RepID=UPI002CE11D9C|nr:amidohydrolase family protein [Actinospica sp.]HWG25556.1 amidohydrolase family protein [Actinospica sp.]